MKKFAKVLIVILAICLTIGIVGLTVSAQKDFDVLGAYVVGDTGYNTLKDAVEAATKTGETIYLNGDINSGTDSANKIHTYSVTQANMGKVDQQGSNYVQKTGSVGAAITTDITIDLNGYTLTQSSNPLSLLYVKSGTLTITGEGTIKDVGTAFNVQGENSKLVIDATGNGIEIYGKNHGSAYCYPIFVAEKGATIDVTGSLYIKPEKNSTMVFRLSGTKASVLDGAKEINIDKANIVVDTPAGYYSQTSTSSDTMNSMFYLKDGTDVNITDSYLKIDTRMFWIPVEKTGKDINISSYMNKNATPKDGAAFSSLAIPEAEIDINVKNSSLIVTGNTNSKQKGKVNNGTLFQVGKARILASFENCYLSAANQAFIGLKTSGSNVSSTSRKISENQFYFKDCVFERSQAINDKDPTVFWSGINAIWEGGAIDNRVNGAYGTSSKPVTLAYNNYEYQALGTGFFGVLLKDCAANVELPKKFTSSSTSSSSKLYIYSHSDATETVSIFEGKDLVDYDYFFGAGKFFTSDDVVLTEAPDFSSAIVDNDSPGSLTELVDEFGNSYYVFGFDETNNEGSGTLKFLTAGASSDFTLFNRVVAEFDVKALGAWLTNGLKVGYNSDLKLPRYDAAGTVIGEATPFIAATLFEIDGEGKLSYGMTDTGIVLPSDAWARISIAIEYDFGDAEEKAVQAYVNDGDGFLPDGTNTTNVSVRKVNAKVSVYLDGKLIGSTDVFPEALAYDGYIPVGYENKITAQDITIEAPHSDGCKLALDNFHIAKRLDVDLGTSIEGAPAQDVSASNYMNLLPDNTIGEAVGEVDGVYYRDFESFLAAIKDGSFAVMYKEFNGLLPVDKAYILVLDSAAGGLSGFYSGTHKAVIYNTQMMVKFLVAGEDEKFETVFKQDNFGIDKTITLVIGSFIPVTDDVLSNLELPYDGKFHKLIGWADKNGNGIIDEKDADADGKIILAPVYEETPYYYTLQVEGGELYYEIGANAADTIADDVTAFLKANPGKRVNLVLWSDAALDTAADSEIVAITVPDDVALYFDLNGKQLRVAANTAAFVGESGAEINLYSTVEGAELYTPHGIVFGNIYTQSEKNFSATVGSVSAPEFGVEADSANLTVVASTLLLLESEAEGIYNNVASLTLNGGQYSATGEGSFPYICQLGGKLSVSVDGAIAALYAPLFSNSNGAILNANITNSSIVTVDSGDEFVDASLVGALTETSEIIFTNSNLSASVAANEGKVILGEDCALSYPATTIPNVTLAEGCVSAYAEYEIEILDVRFPVLGYIDKAEELAHLTWYDSDNKTVIGKTYNALNGKILDAENFAERVNLAVKTDWYEIHFTEWDIPESFGAGEIAIYPICDTRIGTVSGLQYNITAFTYFRFNYYLPAENDIDDFDLIGITTDKDGLDVLPYEIVEIDGEKFYKFSEIPAVSDSSNKHRYVHFSVGFDDYVYEFDFSIPMYAERILDSEDCTELDKRLIMSMVRYSNETYKLENSTAVGTEACEELLANNSELLMSYSDIENSEAFIANKASDTSALAAYMQGATFIFGAQPRFVFLYKDNTDVVLPEDASGAINAWPKDNKGVFAHFYYETAVGGSADQLAHHIAVNGATADAVLNGAWAEGDSVYAMTGDVSICDITQKIKVAVYGTDGTVVRGDYSLATYISNLETNGNGAYYDIAMALYAFSLTAAEYGQDTILD